MTKLLDLAKTIRSKNAGTDKCPSGNSLSHWNQL